MRLNIEKSSVMWFQSRSLTSSALEDIIIDGTCLNSVKTQKYLGIICDCLSKKQPSSHLPVFREISF